jgi:hypothetical protein
MTSERKSRQGPATRRPTVEDQLIVRLFAPDAQVRPDGVLDPRDNAVLDAMAVCAATPGLRRGACQAVFKFLGWAQLSAPAIYEQRFEGRWWLVGGDDGDEDEGGEEPSLHPLARMLLHRWLARDANRWREVHQGFVNYYASPKDAVLRRHHSLALVESARSHQLADVAAYLESRLDDFSVETWLRMLDLVVRAPHRLRTTTDVRVFVNTLTAAAGPEERTRVVTRLAVARWLYNDRLFDPMRQLAQVVADEYDNLARLSGPDGELFYKESTRFRKIEREWEG